MERSRASFNSTNLPDLPAETESTSSESPGALAHRVLFGASLEEKLRLIPLDAAEDSNPAPSSESGFRFAHDFYPSRPENLDFARKSTSRPSLPGAPALVNEESRGVLLHFFANHELLAAELMALALLKFPDAPSAFRQGLAKTLREEQIHTRWYVNRMRDCGVEFGQHPVSRYFWDAVSGMECPLDYVSRLSLTFEQANLDYSLHFAKVLAEAGDHASSAILHRIYRDEIAHVGYGLKWFRRWKDQGESDWNALKNRLHFPLSPSRAKGNRTTFNEEGRRAAGFDSDYIEHLSLFERSKGRTPNIFYFNPDAEHRVASWPGSFQPNKNQISVSRDLELLCAFLARKDDVLLLRRRPGDSHLAKLKRCGLTVPEIETLDSKGRLGSDNLIVQRKIHRLRPWSIAPDLGELFAPLATPAAGDPVGRSWTTSTRSLFSKVDQVRSLGRWMGTSYPCRSTAEMESALIELRNQGFPEALLKRAFSTAGSGMMRVGTDSSGALSRLHLSQKIAAEGGLLVEPAHDRVFDFSVQYQIEAGVARRIGFVEQIISPKGVYRGSICQIKFCRDLDSGLARFLMGEALPIYEDGFPLALALGEWAGARGYEGPLGIDAYVYCNQDGHLCLRPVCEVNPRYTMGRIAHELRHRIAPGRGLKLEILRAEAPSDNSDSVILDEKGRLAGGTVMLTEINDETLFSARISVATRFSRRYPGPGNG